MNPTPSHAVKRYKAEIYDGMPVMREIESGKYVSVVEIRSMANKFTRAKIAARFGVCKSNINWIIKGVTWKENL